ncbi:MAG TPA: sialate O-acetylesterase, partial [Candidatus Cryptobacteroides sp.]|nr:sialate O-acetylesterase [Candidatus Cryptobacteroides sp.]
MKVRLFFSVLSFIVLTALVSSIASCVEASDDFAVPPQFSEGMVLPKNKTINVFGTGSGRVCVEMAGNKVKCKTDDGKWLASLPSMPAGGPYTMTITNKSSKIEIKDIYVGTVVVFAGQSNMQFKLAWSNTPKESYKSDSLMRSFSLPRLEEGEPFTPEDGWVRCTQENAGGWSAIAYHAASHIRSLTGEAVGVINCYQGASIIESWMPAEVMENPKYQLPKEEICGEHFDERYSAWNIPGKLFNLVVVPFAPYSVSAVAWYQGESNTGNSEYKIYPSLFSEMANSWREVYKDEELPFVVIQI